MARKRSFNDKFWYDRHGNFVVWQRPNFLLWIWIAAFIISIILSDGAFERFIGLLGLLAILIWAVLELGWGVNYFRRLVGLGVLLLFAVSHLI